MITLERTHLLRNDLDWLPGWLKALRWTVAGAVWTGLFGGVAALTALAHVQVIFFGKGLAALAVGGVYAGDRAARSVLKRRLARLAHGDVNLARLKQEPDGELVHLVGKVRARGELPTGGVFRRRVFSLGELRLVHEQAVDFALADDQGELVLLQADGARLIVADPKLTAVPTETAQELLSLPLPRAASRAVDRWRTRLAAGKKVQAVRAGVVVLREGQKVEVVGYKTRAVDSSVADRLERDTPLRATLKSGKELPLLISPSEN